MKKILSKLSTAAGTVAKIGGCLFVVILIASITMPDLVADNAGNFWVLNVRGAINSVNDSKYANLLNLRNKDKTMRFRADSAGGIHGTVNFAGIRLMAHAAAVDTLVIPGLSLDTTCAAIVTPFLTVSADTTLTKTLWARPSSYPGSDTVYVFQTTTSSIRALKYSYLIVQSK